MNYVINQNEKYKEYLCGSDEDILDISLKNLIPGSKAYVPSTTNTFILGPDYKGYNKNTGEKETKKDFEAILNGWTDEDRYYTYFNDFPNTVLYGFGDPITIENVADINDVKLTSFDDIYFDSPECDNPILCFAIEVPTEEEGSDYNKLYIGGFLNDGPEQHYHRGHYYFEDGDVMYEITKEEANQLMANCKYFRVGTLI